MIKLNRIASRRQRAWDRWHMIRALDGHGQNAWDWVVIWDVAYHATQKRLDK